MIGNTITRNMAQGWRWLGMTAAATHRKYVGWRTARRALRELELGRRADGSTVVLEYKSGQLVARRSPASPGLLGPLVPFEYADLTWLERVIAMAGYRVRIDEDGDLAVSTEAGRVFVRRCDDEAIIRCFMRVLDNASALSDRSFELVNVFNLSATQGRWVLSDDDVLLMSCDLYAGAGVTSAQLLNTLRAVSHEVSVVMAHLADDRSAA